LLKKIVITGANGFLGTELIKQLIKSNISDNIIAITSQKELLKMKFSSVNFIEYFDMNEVVNIDFSTIDYLIHCAFSRGYKSNSDIAESISFTNNIFNIAGFKGVKNIINISSQGVYGKNNDIYPDEKTKVNPNNLYALAKYSTEILLLNLSKIYSKTNISNIRLASLTGGKENLHLEVISKFVLSALKGETINILGGSQNFSYLDVRDAASAIISMLSSNNWHNIYNLGPEKKYNIIELAEMVVNSHSKYNNKSININVDKSDLSLDVGMNSELFYKNFKWKPNYSMEKTIESLFEYLVEVNLSEFRG